MIRSWRPLSVALVASLCAPIASAKPGLTRLDVAESDSYALLYIPFSAPVGVELPLIIFLHGSGSSPEGWRPFLESVAESLGFALLSPAAAHPAGFGVGADDITIARALELAYQEAPIARQRVSIAGHSAGGAYAVVFGYSGQQRLSGIFTLAAPYRTVLEVADPDYTAPLMAYYGGDDPNYTSGSGPLLLEQLERLGVPIDTQVSPGFGHNSFPDGTLEAGFQFLLGQQYSTAGGCTPTDERLCLREGRFTVTVNFTDTFGNQGTGQVASARTLESGLFTFFSADNWELQIKVLDGCPVNGHYWVLGAASTDVAYTVTVRDLEGGSFWQHTNSLGVLSPAIADVEAFATCP